MKFMINFSKPIRIYLAGCGLDFRAVIADSGAIGGKDTHEFHGAYLKLVKIRLLILIHPIMRLILKWLQLSQNMKKVQRALETLEKVHTPGQKSIEDVSAS